jgi:hypothetical protein
MFFALAVLLIQSQVNPQMALSAEKISLFQPVNSLAASSSSFIEISHPLTRVSSDVSIQPPPVFDSAELPTAPEPVPVNGPTLNAFLRSGKPMTASVGQLLVEERHKDHLWMGLGIAAHSAATFDAWTTRRAITTVGAQEVNPLFKPFAGNASLYAAIQVGPLMMDYVGRKMLYSRHSWVRHMWWVPQSASVVSSLFGGVHNLGVHQTRKPYRTDAKVSSF